MRSSLTAKTWEKFQRASCYPNDCGCESLSSNFVMQPYNTYSNALLIFLGIFLIRKYYKKKNHFLILGSLVLYAGISSAVFHTSFTYFSLLMDFTGISLIIFWSLYILIFKDIKKLCLALLCSYIATMLLILIYEPMRYLIPFTFAIGTAMYYFNKLKQLNISLLNKNVIICVAVLVLGVILFEIDNFRLYCPDIGLHMVWHLIIPISIYNFYLFIRNEKVISQIQATI
jgi:hypothetical protein